MYKQIRSILIGIAFIAGLIVLYYHVIYAPSVRLFKSKIDREFIADMKLKKYVIDNTIESVIVSAKSMSSRSMIRKKIVEYYDGNLSFQQLKEYTEPKYKDGLGAISACNYGARYVDNKLLVENSKPGCKIVESFLSDTSLHKLVATVFLEENTLKVGAISPIYHKEKILGYDIIFSRYEGFTEKILDSTLKLEILDKSNCEDSVCSKRGGVCYVTGHGVANSYYKFTIDKTMLYKGLDGYKKRQLTILLLFSFSIVLVLIFINQRIRLFYFKRGKFLEKLVERKTEELKNMLKDIEKANAALTESQEKLSESNRTKDKFFSIISHDLIGPFGALMNLFHILKNNNVCDTKRTLLIEHGYDAAQSTYRLLENLLTWSRSQRESIPFKPEKNALAVIVSDVIKSLDHQAKDKSIEINTHLDNSLTAIVDKNMLETVFRNLISNAIKFTPDGGRIEIEVNDDKKNGKIIVSVTDNGIGVSQDVQDKLFDIREKITTKGTREESGTGLGLILCKEFIEKHDGKIWVESEKGKGSTFKFTIPANIN